MKKTLAFLILLLALLLPLCAEPYTGVDIQASGQIEDYGGCRALRAGLKMGLQLGAGYDIHEFYGIADASLSLPVKQWRSFTNQTWGWDAALGIGYAIRLANFRIGIGAGYMLQMFVSENPVWSSGIFAELEPSLAVSEVGISLLSVTLPITYVFSKTSPSLRVSAGIRFSLGGSNDSSWI
jgi:hypothetical protein